MEHILLDGRRFVFPQNSVIGLSLPVASNSFLGSNWQHFVSILSQSVRVICASAQCRPILREIHVFDSASLLSVFIRRYTLLTHRCGARYIAVQVTEPLWQHANPLIAYSISC